RRAAAPLEAVGRPGMLSHRRSGRARGPLPRAGGGVLGAVAADPAARARASHPRGGALPRGERPRRAPVSPRLTGGRRPRPPRPVAVPQLFSAADYAGGRAIRIVA